MRINLSKSNQVWDFRTKVRRSIWNVAQAVLFRPTPKRRGNRFRIFLLRCFGAKIQGTPLIHQTCRILLPWELEVGEFSAIAANEPGWRVHACLYGIEVSGDIVPDREIDDNDLAQRRSIQMTRTMITMRTMVPRPIYMSSLFLLDP